MVLEKDHNLGLVKIEHYLMDEFLFNFSIKAFNEREKVIDNEMHC